MSSLIGSTVMLKDASSALASAILRGLVVAKSRCACLVMIALVYQRYVSFKIFCMISSRLNS